METWIWIVVVVVAVLVAVAVAYTLASRRRTTRLKSEFGPEYDRAVEATGSRTEAEHELADIEDRRRHLEIVPLSPTARRQYVSEWEAIQRDFVDEPTTAVAAADDLIVTVMAERGYPVDDTGVRGEMISIDHADVAGHFRAANAIRRLGREATTEDLREAFVHYRALFDHLLTDEPASDVADPAPDARRAGRHDQER